MTGQHIAVEGIAEFVGMGEAVWTPEETQPIVAVLSAVNAKALRQWGSLSARQPNRGVGQAWVFVKRDPSFEITFWSWLETWQSSSWGDPTPEAVAQKLTDYYADMLPVMFPVVV